MNGKFNNMMVKMDKEIQPRIGQRHTMEGKYQNNGGSYISCT